MGATGELAQALVSIFFVDEIEDEDRRRSALLVCVRLEHALNTIAKG